MPTYEYECGQCSLRFELRRRFGEDPGAVCPRCEGLAHRVFTPVPIIFKGPGFYVTDSRGSNRWDDGHHDPGGGRQGKRPAAEESPVTA
ncbi:MAG: FmdB family zinc ribbon protein [Chloroflexota bacterium]